MGRRSVGQRCSFCGKAKDQVSKLIAGPGAFICDECVGLCTEILDDEPPAAKRIADEKADWVKKTRGSSWLRRLFRGFDSARHVHLMSNLGSDSAR